MNSQLLKLWRPLTLHEVWGLWVSVGLALLGYRFGWGRLPSAEYGIWHLGYAMTWGVTLYFLWAIRSQCVEWLHAARKHCWELGVLVVLTGIIHLAEVHALKVPFDEHAHAMSAMVMHFTRKWQFPLLMHFADESPRLEYVTATFRSHYFSYIVSVAHDFMGFAECNIYIVNGVLGFGSLITVYALAKRVSNSCRVALAIAVFFAGIPVYGYVATSGAYDMSNIFFLGLVLVFAFSYVTSRSWADWRALVLSAVILSYCRNESLAYFAVPVVVAFVFREDLYAAMRVSRIRVAEFILSPVLLLPSLWTQMVLMYSDRNITQGHKYGGAWLSFDYLCEHLLDTGRYFLNFSQVAMSSVVFFVLILAAILILGLRLIKGCVRDYGWADVCLVLLPACVAILFYCTIMATFWGGPNTPVMTRFVLPLWFFGALLLALAMRTMRGQLVGRGMLAAAYAVFILFSLGVYRSHGQLHVIGTAYNVERAVSWVKGNCQRRDLYVTMSPSLLISRCIPCISYTMLKNNADKYLKLTQAGVFGRILIVEEVRASWKESGKWVYADKTWENMQSDWDRRVLWEESNDPGSWIRVAQLTSYRPTGQMVRYEGAYPLAGSYEEQMQKLADLVPVLTEN